MGRADLAHHLVMCEPLSVAGEAPMIAASIASAGTLCIEPDAAAVRQSIRSGAIDFTVNTLDEALRALKNELRKGLSIAVCLEGDPQEILPEMFERGVQPDVVCCSPALDGARAAFVERGARVIDLGKTEQGPGLAEARWHVNLLPGKWLPRVDDAIAAVLPEDDTVRRNWLRRAPRYLGRALRIGRYLPMTRQEREIVVAVLRRDGEGWDVVVTLEYDGGYETFGGVAAG